MKRCVTALLWGAIAFVLATPASAQTVHGGVEVDRLVPVGMAVVEVRAPERVGAPSRLVLASRGQARAELVVDVLIAGDHATARAALASQLRAIQGELPAVSGLGDEGSADEGFAAFVRDNVMIAIRRVSGARDVPAIARVMDAVIVAAPSGSPRSGLRVQVPDVVGMRIGEVLRLAAPADALGTNIAGSGDVAARRTRDGFVVERTGGGAATLRVIVVDRLLRVGG